MSQPISCETTLLLYSTLLYSTLLYSTHETNLFFSLPHTRSEGQYALKTCIKSSRQSDNFGRMRSSGQIPLFFLSMFLSFFLSLSLSLSNSNVFHPSICPSLVAISSANTHTHTHSLSLSLPLSLSLSLSDVHPSPLPVHVSTRGLAEFSLVKQCLPSAR